MFKTINDNFKLQYNEGQQHEAEIMSEIITRILCVTSGFTASTYNMDFSFGIPITKDFSKYLSLCNNDGHLYFGVYDAINSHMCMDADVNTLSHLSQASINTLLTTLHDNEMHAATNHDFLKTMNTQTFEKAWGDYFKSPEHTVPARREYKNIVRNELSVKQYYDMSVSTPRKEFVNWMLDKNPTEQEIKNRIPAVLNNDIVNNGLHI